MTDGPALARAALTLARRFAAGATLWSVSPGAPHHAHHVAVEFVHPVVVGARSFPAAVLEDVGQLQAGDVLLAIGAADDPRLAPLLQRCGPRGVTPLLLDGGDDVLLAYHVLWELTQVVFEHPGLLREPEPAPCADEVCITCADEARVVEVVRLLDDGTASGLDRGAPTVVDLTVVPGVDAGDLVLVHAGLAIAAVVEGAAP